MFSSVIAEREVVGKDFHYRAGSSNLTYGDVIALGVTSMPTGHTRVTALSRSVISGIQTRQPVSNSSCPMPRRWLLTLEDISDVFCLL